ncbi:MAG: Hypothetical protein BHV28_13990 [Candidatus Tokpelaia hoelldobleri]|uniref:Uncharacterized protein n=1 Tax=Candidatus Tokpelaia hoelldobleri TaxID=1902579 RepID=A0A1U9JW30_9HYPH|nr:MAG: Hypothetical protein BHV28_13990 [Candidatus Tokpelaia hoelldoblerii]
MSKAVSSNSIFLPDFQPLFSKTSGNRLSSLLRCCLRDEGYNLLLWPIPVSGELAGLFFFLHNFSGIMNLCVIHTEDFVMFMCRILENRYL